MCRQKLQISVLDIFDERACPAIYEDLVAGISNAGGQVDGIYLATPDCEFVRIDENTQGPFSLSRCVQMV
ncbi:hypothetical protein BB934_28280 (plasmid) [Microvirga ossetica]|uniref:Uncharacterized protein n=1 Tax=Microvirga ossetica TaxID=1882682 RepID=A0A1B2EQI6_9HYPH|nr:hypothetical protein BB934_28280 [Microvirga ossetica]